MRELYDWPGRDGLDAGRAAPAAHDRSPTPAPGPRRHHRAERQGRHGTLVTRWLTENRAGDGAPRLITTWAQPHRDKETGQ